MAHVRVAEMEAVHYFFTICHPLNNLAYFKECRFIMELFLTCSFLMEGHSRSFDAVFFFKIGLSERYVNEKKHHFKARINK